MTLACVRRLEHTRRSSSYTDRHDEQPLRWPLIRCASEFVTPPAA